MHRCGVLLCGGSALWVWEVCREGIFLQVKPCMHLWELFPSQPYSFSQCAERDVTIGCLVASPWWWHCCSLWHSWRWFSQQQCAWRDELVVGVIGLLYMAWVSLAMCRRREHHGRSISVFVQEKRSRGNSLWPELQQQGCSGCPPFSHSDLLAAHCIECLFAHWQRTGWREAACLEQEVQLWVELSHQKCHGYGYYSRWRLFCPLGGVLGCFWSPQVAELFDHKQIYWWQAEPVSLCMQ